MLSALLAACGAEPVPPPIATPPPATAVASAPPPLPEPEPGLVIDHPCAKGDILACARLGLSLAPTAAPRTLGEIARNHAAVGEEKLAEALISDAPSFNPHGLMMMVAVGFLEGGDADRAHKWFQKARSGPPHFRGIMIESYVRYGFDAQAEKLASETGGEVTLAEAMFENGRTPADVRAYLVRSGHDLDKPRGGEAWAEIYGRIGIRDPGIAFVNAATEPAHHLNVIVAVAEGDLAAGRTSGVKKMLKLGKKHLRRGREGVDDGGHKLIIGSKRSTVRTLVLLHWRVHGLDEARKVAALDNSRRTESLAYVACHMHAEGKKAEAAKLIDELVPKKNTWWGPQDAHRDIARSAAAGGCADLAKHHAKAAVDHIRTYPDEDIIGNHNRLPGELAGAGLWEDAAYICKRRKRFASACLVDDVLRPAARAQQSDFIVSQLEAVAEPSLLGSALSLLAVSLNGKPLSTPQRKRVEKATDHMLRVWLVSERLRELDPKRRVTTYHDDADVLVRRELALFIGAGPNEEQQEALEERDIAIVVIPRDWDGTKASLQALIDRTVSPPPDD